MTAPKAISAALAAAGYKSQAAQALLLGMDVRNWNAYLAGRAKEPKVVTVQRWLSAIRANGGPELVVTVTADAATCEGGNDD